VRDARISTALPHKGAYHYHTEALGTTLAGGGRYRLARSQGSGSQDGRWSHTCGGYPCFFFAAIDSEAWRIADGPEPSAMQKRCKITRCVYNPLLSLWDRQSSNTLLCKGFFSSVIRGEQNLKANVHKEFRFTSSQSDRRGLSLLSRCKKGLIAPGLWAGRWVIVSGRSPRPAH
jgi:hypothetical protein